jgi:membrane protease subunit HflC
MTRNPFTLVVVLLGIGLVAANSAFVVDQRELAVKFYFGELTGGTYAPGLHLKLPFAETVRRFDSRLLTLDNQTENFLTVEKKNVEVDYYVKWRIADAAVYYRATRGQELAASDLLAAIINKSMRDEFGSRTIQQAVTEERDDIMKAIMGTAAAKVADLGVQIADVRIMAINLPKEVSDSVYERMRAERTRVAADLRARGAEEAEKIKADADRDAQVTLANAYREAEQAKGEGDARAAEIYAKAYGQDAEFYSFYRTLNVYRESFSGNKDVLVLEPKGHFFRYFNGEQK